MKYLYQGFNHELKVHRLTNSFVLVARDNNRNIEVILPPMDNTDIDYIVNTLLALRGQNEPKPSKKT